MPADTKIKSISDTMRERAQNLPASTRATVDRALSAFDAVGAKKKALNSAAADYQEKLREGVARDGGPMLGRAAWEVQAGKRKLENDRAELRERAIKHDSPRSAAMAAETRAYLRTLDPSKAAAVVIGPNADPLAQRAVLEAPAFLSGIGDDVRARAEAGLLARHHGAEVAALDAQAEALTHAEAAVALATGEMQRALGFNARDFATWFDGLKPSPEQIAAEAAEAKAARDAAREAFVEKRLAELAVGGR